MSKVEVNIWNSVQFREVCHQKHFSVNIYLGMGIVLIIFPLPLYRVGPDL